MISELENSSAGCERPVNLTGWGLYHYFTIGLASACAFSQATALMSISFAIPLTACDLSLSSNMIAIIDMCFSFGMAIGGYLLSSISDISGRKTMIPITLLIIFSSSFACGFAHGFAMLLTCVFLLGCGIAANASCVKIHLAEILPAERRGRYLVFPDLFWSLGYILFATISWLLTPFIISQQNKDMRLTTWRLMFGLSGACSIMIACASALIKPSPRYLLFIKNIPEALNTFKHIYAINNSKHTDTYLLQEEELEFCVDDFSLNNEPQPIYCREHFLRALRTIQRLSFQLVRKRFIRITALLIFTRLAVLFDILVINIWLTKMLQYSNNKCSYLKAVDILHLEGTSVQCMFHPNEQLYGNFFLLAINIVMGQLISFLLVDRIGRRIALIGGFIACGASSFALGYIHNFYVVQLMTSFIFVMAYSIVNSTLNIVEIEAYPTAFRGTAAGGTQLFARLASGFVKWLLQTPCQYSFIFIGALLLAAAVLSCFLPELRRKPMVE